MPLIAPLQMALPLLREAITFRSATPAVSFVAIECMGNAVMQNVSWRTTAPSSAAQVNLFKWITPLTACLGMLFGYKRDGWRKEVE